MRSDQLYLADILDAIEWIERWLAAEDGEALFLEDAMLQSAVLQKLSNIGEAAARLSEAAKIQAPDIPWKEIVGFRNIAVHAYFSVDWRIVYITAKDDLPPLRVAIKRLLGMQMASDKL